jgi:integrase
MPKRRKKEKIPATYFHWLLGQRRGIYFADGRSNPIDAGRHSLDTRDRREAIDCLKRLDLKQAVKWGKAPATVLDVASDRLLTLEEGRRLYMAHAGRPLILKGVTPNSLKRYRAVLDKFIRFAMSKGVHHWQGVTKPVLQAYCSWLDDQDRGEATIYLELTTLKQILNWMALESKLIPESHLFKFEVSRPDDTTTYCYTPEQVDAIVEHCFATPGLHWLGLVVLALASTGMRIGELANLKWDNVEFAANLIRLWDRRRMAPKSKRAGESGTKNHRSREIPIQPRLLEILQGMNRIDGDYVFHAAQGGKLDPDKVLKVLIRDVLTPLAPKFPEITKNGSFIDGRVHSFRHYFCSACASNRVPIETLMKWLGHRNSRMVRRYYHLWDEDAQAQMKELKFVSDSVTTSWRQSLETKGDQPGGDVDGHHGRDEQRD